MKNKKIILVGIPILIILAIVVFLIVFMSSTKIQSFYPSNNEDVTGITITNGNNGQIATITDKEKCMEILEKISDIECRRDIFRKQTSGWLYRITICFGDKQVEIVSSPLSVNGVNYSYAGKFSEENWLKEFHSYLEEVIKLNA